jgi:hypothetical protein
VTLALLTQIRRKLTIAVSIAASIVVAIIGMTVVATTPAYALGAGTVCMFNAPTGAALGPLHEGHVGWAFREGNTTTWEYGATENASTNWRGRGDQNAMFNTFRQRKGNATPYYTQWRCHASPNSSVGAASTEVDQLNKQAYTLLSDNCLTRSIEIFKAYDGTTFDVMPSGYATAPDGYFDALDQLGFGPVHPL